MDWRRKAGDHEGHVDSVEHRDDRVVVAFSWSDRGGTRHKWAQVLNLTDGKITAIQDYARPSRAALAARVRAVFT